MSESKNINPLAELLRTRRDELGLTLYELEQRSGVPRPHIRRLEQGETINPSMEILNKLANALDLDAEDLYDAHWQTNRQPLPGVSTYFRSRYSLNDRQIAEIERLVDGFDHDDPPS